MTTITIPPIAAAATWTEIADYQAQPTRPAIVMIGDSISQHNEAISTWNGSSLSRGAAYQCNGYLTCAQVWDRQPANWLNKGVSGNLSSDGLARFDTDVTTFAPQVVVVEFGTEDIAGGATAAATFANLLAMWTKAWAFGAKVIAMTCPPRNSFTTGQAQEACKLNALIRNFANTNPDNLALVDAYAVLVNPLTGQYQAAYTFDGTNPSDAGAWALGKAFESALDRFLPAATPNLAADNVFDIDNLLANPLMTGTGGTITSNTGVTGTLAASWSAGSTGTNANLTSVLSQVTRPDGYGNWQQINTTVTPTSTAYVELYQGISGWAVGDIVQATVEFETDAAGWTNGIFDSVLFMNDSSANIVQHALSFGPSDEATVGFRPESGVLQTPSLVIPPGTVIVNLLVSVGGLGTARIGRAAFRKLAPAP
jgi:lysophospholipase L1-like esterase